MRKLIIIHFVLFFISVSNSQEDVRRNPNVELPEFVITGSDIVNIQKAKKIEADMIPVLNEQFLKPTQSPEELGVGELSDPIKEEFSLLDSLNYFTGKLEAGIGSYTLPGINFLLSSPFENGIFQITAIGKNRRAYVDHSELYYLNSGVTVFYQLKSESALFSGTRFQFHGDYGRTSHKLFAADDPFIKRELNKGNVSLNVENLLEDKFNYVLTFSDDIHSLQENVYSENFIKFGGMLRANFSNLNIGVNALYNVQSLKNEVVLKSTRDLFSIRPFVGFSIREFLKASVGLNYTNFSDKSKFYPYLFSGIKLNDRISAYLEFAPQSVMLNNGYFLDKNPYFYIQNFVNLIHEKKNFVQAVAKYEYDKYYEVNAGVKYFSSDASPYFESSALSGRFNVAKTPATSYTGFVNLLFHLGPYGFFYGSVELNETKSSSGNVLPYYPVINSYFTYGYNFAMGFGSKVKLNFMSKQFTDILNTNSINPFVNLSLDFTYKISPQFNLTFELNNLLNKTNHLWIGYKEMPLDFTAGVIYRW